MVHTDFQSFQQTGRFEPGRRRSVVQDSQFDRSPPRLTDGVGFGRKFDVPGSIGEEQNALSLTQTKPGPRGRFKIGKIEQYVVVFFQSVEPLD